MPSDRDEAMSAETTKWSLSPGRSQDELPDEFLELPLRLRRAMREARARVSPRLSGANLWEQVLTPCERDRLGGDFERAWQSFGTIGMWMELRGVSRWRAIIEAAAALQLLLEPVRGWLLREVAETQEDSRQRPRGQAAEIIDEDLRVQADRALEGAIKRSPLVLVESPRLAYWRGERIKISWQKFPARWEYFLRLCQEAKRGKSIDDTLFAEDVKPGYAAKLKSRLVNTKGFPETLEMRIVTAGRGSQKLDLPPREIRLFERESFDHLREKR